ncbi:hypothetical protein P8C59_007259 [Phyllachora maydis]|uniref:Uncharacterized protein n=1 Tax=Phyllachora maydis TaxID=1825666 RepID=A0AAD9I971_9PEZI|nr:hypothetical protein P8C59_007259 [Phyllachora maydis]
MAPSLSWGTWQSLLLVLGPLFLPKAISYYRSVRNGARRRPNLPVVPAPPAVSAVLVLLAGAALLCLCLALPPFAPENVFAVTQSRLQIPVDVLFTRLASLRPNATLTARDTALRARFVNLESRLLYCHYGPAALADCPFCASDDPATFLYYAAADVAAPHLLNLAGVTAATSAALAGRPAAAWRAAATVAAVVLAAVDGYLLATYDHGANRGARRLGDVDFFHWRARAARLVALAALDAALAGLVWLTATRRAFVTAPTPAERVEGVARALAAVKSSLHAVGIVKNTAIRDEELRARSQAYWDHEVSLMREVMEEKEVIERINDALQNRIDIQQISREADMYAQSMFASLVPPTDSSESTRQQAVPTVSAPRTAKACPSSVGI